tara:strand:- start:3368 stop:3778 length:411 start_codon:yes stop_codon:yes gene_type:complete
MNWNNILNRNNIINIMENIYCDVIEKDNKEQIDIHQLLTIVDDNNSLNKDINCIDEQIALELDYSNNYTVKSLGKILDFYELSKKKMRKDEMIQLIVIFETDPNNYILVENRKQLWKNFKELKEHSFFSKYILFEL